jgi:hypothetical protein
VMTAGPLAATGDAAYWCGTRWMNVQLNIYDEFTGFYTYSQYKISAYACWDHTTSWAGSSGQPTVTYLGGGRQATSYTKGNYLMADGVRTDFWVNLKYYQACRSFPFWSGYATWYPRIKVNEWGASTASSGTVTAIPCYTFTTQILAQG